MTLLQVSTLFLVLLPCGLGSSTGNGGGGRFSNYAAYHYDQTTPMFTPDGRLLQVEYASLASTHSSPLLLFSSTSTTTTTTTTTTTADNDNCLVLIAHHSQSKRTGQDRLVQLSSSSSHNHNKNSIVVGMSGILGDSVALLQQIQKKYEENLRLYNFQQMQFQDVITALGDACQRHSFGGGIRPYGSQMIVCTSSRSRAPHKHEKNNNHNNNCSGTTPTTTFQIATIDPSGSIHMSSIHDDSTVSSSKSSNRIRLVGGTKGIHDQIRKELEQQHFFSSLDDLPSSLRAACSTMRTILGKKTQNPTTSTKKKNSSLVVSSSKEGDTTTATAAQAAQNNGKDDTSTNDSWLEVVIISETKGVYRMTDRQIEALLNSSPPSSVTTTL